MKITPKESLSYEKKFVVQKILLLDFIQNFFTNHDKREKISYIQIMDNMVKQYLHYQQVTQNLKVTKGNNS